VETLRHAADDFLSRFGVLLDEVVALREALAKAQEENRQLRVELTEGIDLFRDARALVASAGPVKRGRARGAQQAKATAPPRGAGRPRTRPAAARGAGRAQRTPANGRVTPASVTPEVVRAVIGKLGTATAAEVAAQITKAGTPVSGRAVRHIAKVAGAVARPGDEGRMVYSLS
jgi:hypothetical protein